MSCKIVAISDTHGEYKRLNIPECDILIHAGDITCYGLVDELYDFNSWIEDVNAKYKVVIAGNHDKCLYEKQYCIENVLTNCVYLCDSSVDINGVVIYGTPWQNSLPDWYGYTSNLEEKMDIIPDNVDILVTHTPAYGHRDVAHGDHLGSIELDDTVRRIRPKYHVFGHIHEGYGVSDNGYTTIDLNSSVMDRSYCLVNDPIVFEFNR